MVSTRRAATRAAIVAAAFFAVSLVAAYAIADLRLVVFGVIGALATGLSTAYSITAANLQQKTDTKKRRSQARRRG